MRPLVIVPAYNEEESLPSVVRDLWDNFTDADIIVINDGSADQTSEVARSLGARVIDLPYNLGIGGAMQTGFLYAMEHGYEVAVQFDGDGQHRADEIPKILASVTTGSADMAIGSRFLGAGEPYDVPFARRLGIRLFAFVQSRLTGLRLTDTTSGFRAYGKKAIETFADYYPDDYPEVEAIAILVSRGLGVVEVPALMRPRAKGRSSITPLRAVYYMVKVLISVFVGHRPGNGAP